MATKCLHIHLFWNINYCSLKWKYHPVDKNCFSATQRWKCQNNIPVLLLNPVSTMGEEYINTLRPRQNGRHIADDIFKCIFMNENEWISLKTSLKFVPKVRINNIPVLVQKMAWRLPGDKPLSEPMMDGSLTHIWVTRPQWVNTLRPRQNGRHIADDIFKCIFLNENIRFFINTSLKFVPKGPIKNIPALVQIMAWGWPGNKPLSQQWWQVYWPIYLSLGLNELTHIGLVAHMPMHQRTGWRLIQLIQFYHLFDTKPWTETLLSIGPSGTKFCEISTKRNK